MEKEKSHFEAWATKIGGVLVLAIGGYYLVQLTLGDASSKPIGAMTMGDLGNILLAFFIAWVAFGAIKGLITDND